MNSKNILWVAPFFCFIGGYLVVKSMFHLPNLPAPSVIGKPLTDALIVLSDHNLNVQPLTQKEDQGLPEGTVTDQIPSPGQRVKTRQTIFLTVSQKPSLIIAPSLIGKSRAQVTELLSPSGIQLRAYFLTHPYLTDTCIAQTPSAGKPLRNRTVIAYFSKGSAKPTLWPNFVGKSLTRVIEFLDQYHITPCIQSEPASDPAKDSIVSKQHPQAGSIITLDPNKPPIVQLCVE